jgi:hypothetical protein
MMMSCADNSLVTAELNRQGVAGRVRSWIIAISDALRKVLRLIIAIFIFLMT